MDGHWNEKEQGKEIQSGARHHAGKQPEGQRSERLDSHCEEEQCGEGQRDHVAVQIGNHDHVGVQAHQNQTGHSPNPPPGDPFPEAPSRQS